MKYSRHTSDVSRAALSVLSSPALHSQKNMLPETQICLSREHHNTTLAWVPGNVSTPDNIRSKGMMAGKHIAYILT